MSLHVIVGSGPVGSATAMRLAGRGERARVITRSGTGPAAEGIENLAADAGDPGRLTALARGAAVLYNCASPPYHRWPQEWPPLASSLLTAAERTGAVLVTMSNLYGYGPVGHPMTEHDPLSAAGPNGITCAALPIRRVAGPACAAALAVHSMADTALTGAACDIDGGGQILPSSGG